MGKSDTILEGWYKQYIQPDPRERVALLGFTNNNWFPGELFDKQLGNWDINEPNWRVNGPYDRIICLRTAYFSNNPDVFIEKCAAMLKPKGKLHVDWGLGDHWRYENYKIGWVSGGEQEEAFDNPVYSGFWNDKLLEHPEVKEFEKHVKKYGYNNLVGAIRTQVPKLLEYEKIQQYFTGTITCKMLWPETPQLYILMNLTKK